MANAGIVFCLRILVSAMKPFFTESQQVQEK